MAGTAQTPRSIDKVCVIGSFSTDVIIELGSESRRMGGAVTYTGLSLSKLGVQTKLVFAAAAADLEATTLLQQACDCEIISAEQTTVFENANRSDGSRSQRLLQRAKSIEGAAIGDFDARCWVHFAPLHPDDIALSAFEKAKSAGYRSLDMQGFLRFRQPDMQVVRKLDNGWKAAATAVEWLKFSAGEWAHFVEATAMSPQSLLRACDLAGIIVTEGASGGWYFCEGERFAFESACSHGEMTNPTGAGDVFMAGFIASAADGTDWSTAIRAAASLAAEQVGDQWLKRDLLQIP